VTVIDRQATPGAETSFANGGQISVSHAEPWANPGAPLKVLQWLGKEDAPCCSACAPMHAAVAVGPAVPARMHARAHPPQHRQIVRLGTYSRAVLQQLRRDAGLDYRPAHPGHPALLYQPKEFDGAEARPRRCARWGATAA
jgi:D-amino-acid dehydrogenase